MSETTESVMQLVVKMASILGAGIPIPGDELTGGWKADYYVLCVPTFTISPAGDLTFQYDPEASGVYRVADMKTAGIPNIDAFVEALYDGTFQEAKTLPFDAGPKAMEFALKRNCNVVIALADLNWQFNRCYYAVTIDGKYANYYGNLRQLNKDGDRQSMPPPDPPLDQTTIPKIGPWSTIAYFSARRVPDNVVEEHPFNLHIQIIQGNQLVPITIDPDIKNDGNGPTWP